MHNICLVIPSFYPAIVYGGPIYSSLYASEELALLGCKVYVSTTNASGNVKLKVPINQFIQLKNNLYVKYYNETFIGRFSFSLLTNLWKDIRSSDLVHIQAIFSSPTPISLFYSWFYRKPVLLSPRGALGEWCLHNKKSLFKTFWLKCLILPFKQKITWHATSEQEKKEILTLDKNAKVIIVPNGYEPGIQYVPHVENRINKKKTIISMGRIHKKKGFDILIRAFKEILKLYPDSELLIAGKDDGELESLSNLIKTLQLSDKISFLTHLDGKEKNQFLSSGDVFVLPSYNENFGNVYAEALAAGTPIVASTNTPWEEVETAGCGRWVPNTVEDTTAAILDLLSRDREQLRKNALKFVQKYDWKNIALQFKEHYEQMLK